MLNIFQCNHDPGMCPTWEGGSGANACFVAEPEELTAGLAPMPSDGPPVELEVRIVSWLPKEDHLQESVAGAFYSGETYFALPETELKKVTSSTRLGGVPYWIQSPDEAPRDGWRFVGQLDSGYSFLVPPRKPQEGIEPDLSAFEGRTHFAPGPNFGDGGVAYLFLRDGDEKPEGWFFWQCG